MLKALLASLALVAMSASAHADANMVFRYKNALVSAAAPDGGNGGEETGGEGNGGETGSPSDPGDPSNPGDSGSPYSLKSGTLPDATEGSAWSFDFKALLDPEPEDMASVSWRIEPFSNLPPLPYLSMSEDGVLSGTPLGPGLQHFYIVATVDGKDVRQAYSFDVAANGTYAKSLVDGNGLYILTEDGAVWFDDGTNVPKKVVGLESGVAKLYGGYGHRCVIKTDSTAWCWGSNSYGQIGTGEIGYGGSQSAVVPAPVPVQGLESPPVSMGLGYYNTCAILANGSTKCWGSNYYGQIGNGSNALTELDPLPTGLSALNPLDWGEINSFHKIDVSDNHVCAISETDHVWCWGYDSYGQVGVGDVATKRIRPREVFLPDAARDVAAGVYFTCAIIDTGEVYCWGTSRKGQVGDGSDNYSNPTPQKVSGIGNAVSISAGSDHACALLADGRVMCWGAGDYGQLGNGILATARQPVLALNGKSDVIEVRAMKERTCVLDASRRITCFGYGATPRDGEVTLRPWEGTDGS